MAGVIDTILELQKDGLSDSEIVSRLRSMKYTAQEITDAINQIKIKSAVAGDKEDMQPSIMQQEEEEVPVPTKKARPKGGVKEMSQQYQNYPQQQYSSQTKYSPEQQSQPSQAADIETIEEIAEEIVSEKFSEIKDKMSSILDFKDNVELKISNLNDRLKRIEASIDSLQASVIGRVQQYGQDIKSLGSDMQALHTAFGQVVNPLIDNVRERTGEKPKQREVRKEVR